MLVLIVAGFGEGFEGIPEARPERDLELQSGQQVGWHLLVEDGVEERLVLLSGVKSEGEEVQVGREVFALAEVLFDQFSVLLALLKAVLEPPLLVKVKQLHRNN